MLKLNLLEEKILETISNTAKNILIIGSGDGRLGKYLRDRLKNIYLVGIEEDKELAEISNNFLDKVIVKNIEQDIDNLDLKENFFDTLIYFDLDRYISNPFTSLKKYNKFLKDDGDIFCTFYNTHSKEYLQNSISTFGSKIFTTLNCFPLFPYNIILFSEIANISSWNIESFLGLLNPEANTISANQNSLSFSNLNITFSANDSFQKYNFYVYYYLLRAKKTSNPKVNTSVDIQNHGVLQAVSFDKIRDIRFRYPAKYWKKYGAYYFAIERKGIEKETLLIKESEYLANIISDYKPDTILELGCGYGRVLKELAKKNKQATITGIDISKDQLKEAKEYLKDFNVSLLEYNGIKLPFDDNSFDVVYTCGVFSVLPPEIVYPLLKEVYRVSKKIIIHDEEVFGDSVRFYKHEYDTAYIRNGVLLEKKEENPFKSEKITFVFNKTINNIDWDFDKLLDLDVYFLVFTPNDYLEIKNIMKHLPNSQLLLSEELGKNLFNWMQLYFDSRAIPFIIKLPKKYDSNKHSVIICPNKRADISIQDPEIDRSKYIFIKLLTSLSDKNIAYDEKINSKYDLILAPGKYSYNKYSKKFASAIVGFPKLDNAYLKTKNKMSVIKELNLLSLLNDKKTILYAPTHNSKTIDIYKNKLISLKSKYNLLFRLHFLNNLEQQGIDYINYFNRNGIATLNPNEVEIERALVLPDLVITDYSGIAFEAMSLNIPILLIDSINPSIFLNPEKDNLEITRRDFAVRVDNPENLEEKVAEALNSKIENREEIINNLISYRDGSASRQVIKVILNFLEKRNFKR